MSFETWHGYKMERFQFESRDAIVVFPKEVRSGAPWALKTEYWMPSRMWSCGCWNRASI